MNDILGTFLAIEQLTLFNPSAAGLYVAAAALAWVAVPSRERAPARRMALEKGGDGARMRA